MNRGSLPKKAGSPQQGPRRRPLKQNLQKRLLLNQAHQKMLEHYGPLNWWPGETPFEVMVGAILTQNTAWTNVEKAIANLKRAGVLELRALLQLKPGRLARLIRPAGYFRVKTKRLRNFLKFLAAEGVAQGDGDISVLKKQPLAVLREKLLAVNGVGPETADSILLYALGKPVFVIDAYTKRILERHFFAKKDISYEELQNFFMEHLNGAVPSPQNVALYNEYHAQLVNIGKDFCRTKPKCEKCPLNGWNWQSRDGSRKGHTSPDQYISVPPSKPLPA